MAEKKLRKGFTTGAAASAAAKAALISLLIKPPEAVEISFLTGEKKLIPIDRFQKSSDFICSAIVIKDAGDDPDVTHKAEIGAQVTIRKSHRFHVDIKGGEGVGIVTRPGLEIEVGEAAINPGPRKMIFNEIKSVFTQHPEFIDQAAGDNLRIEVLVFVPKGKILAQKTLNRKLGIVGGISILGTTGIVTPMSHDAYIATIKSGIDVASAAGTDTLVFTTGRRSERFSMEIFQNLEDVAFIQIGDFFKASLEMAVKNPSIKEVVHAVFFGKAVKMAMGFGHTHAAKSELTLKTLSEWTLKITGNKNISRKIAACNTARQAFSFLFPGYPEVINLVAQNLIETSRQFSRGTLNISVILFDFDGNVILSKK